MDVKDVSTDVREHGAAIPNTKGRVGCNYCGKTMSGFNRLRYHLGHVRGDVVACPEVPADVRVAFHQLIAERVGMKNQVLKREARPSFSRSSGEFGSVSGLDNSESAKRRRSDGSSFIVSAEAKLKLDGNLDHKKKTARKLLKCVGEFFAESGLAVEVVDSPSFKRMLDFAIEVDRGHKVPTSAKLKDFMDRGEDDELNEYVNSVKSSWVTTGCSILLDYWSDGNGRMMVGFLADCSQGTIFIKSVDVSDSMADVDKLFLLVDNVIEEVGTDNVVQVITYRVSHIMENVGKKIVEKHRKIFWTVCASHCISLILDRIRNMDLVTDVLDKAKSITKFIYNNPSILKMMKKYTLGKDLIRTSTVKSASPFLTLEIIVSERESLITMFESSEWESSNWASDSEGKKVAELIQNPYFWSASEDVLNAAIPLVCVIRLITSDSKPSTGYIYETMDQAKEKVQKNLGDVQSNYEPVWEIIDDIWDNRLHSALHCAGYFLNPVLFYADDFFADAEVASGLLCCIVRMADDCPTQDRIVKQLEEYRAANGNFGEDIAIDKRRQLIPAQWWSAFGGHCPDLQKLAIRILSQTCCGASRFNLKRIIPETVQVHPTGVNGEEQEKQFHSEYIHYNLLLKDYPSPSIDEKSGLLPQELGQMADWIGEAQTQESANGYLDYTDAADKNIKTSSSCDSSERLPVDQVKAEIA